ncbi:MAG: TlpA family protein disulfide reductase [Chloroflexi bacterium]|nr:TlpA family protein disulfide reductase [Chloroflexota bacterium]
MKKIIMPLVIMVVIATLMTITGLSCKQQPFKLPGSLVPPEQVLPQLPQEDPQPFPVTERKEKGDTAPDFTLQTIDGQTLTLSQFLGKNPVLNFWVSTCPACLEELPLFQAIYNKLPTDKTVILAVNAGERDKIVQYEAQRMKLTFPVLLDPDGKVCKSYGRGSPTTFFIDNKGTIIEIVDEVFEDPKEIENILKIWRWL